MKITPREDITARKKAIDCELCRVRELAPVPEPVCTASCPDYKASTGCHRHCQHVPKRLSSAGESEPIEPLIAPLAFELKRLGLFHPCWSCEGHNDAAGKLWKIPRLWFYADSVVHVRCLRDAVAELVSAHKLSSPWLIVLTFSDAGNPDTTFSLEPGPIDPGARLQDLQNDVKIISENLHHLFAHACNQLSKNAC